MAGKIGPTGRRNVLLQQEVMLVLPVDGGAWRGRTSSRSPDVPVLDVTFLQSSASQSMRVSAQSLMRPKPGLRLRLRARRGIFVEMRCRMKSQKTILPYWPKPTLKYNRDSEMYLRPKLGVTPRRHTASFENSSPNHMQQRCLTGCTIQHPTA